MAILTISRDYGSGGREVGRSLADRLGYRYVDRVTLQAALSTADPRWVRFAEEYDERKPSVWERYDWSFRGYAALLQRHILEAAAAGRVVIVGRGGAFLLAGVPTALHVRVVAPLAARIERITRREHADHVSVRRMVERIDRERAGFIRAIYGRAWDDPGAYDLICDTSLLEPAAIVDDLVARLVLRDRADEAAAARLIDLRLAAARVRAALLTEPRLQLPTLEVPLEGDRIVVRGVLHRPEEKRLIQELAQPQAGNHPVRFDLHTR
jgi:cytidylate kinase